GVIDEDLAGAVGERFLDDQSLGVVLVAYRVAVLQHGFAKVAERVIGEGRLSAVRVGDAEQVSRRIVAVLGLIARRVGDRGQGVQGAVGHLHGLAQWVDGLGQVAVAVVGVLVRVASGVGGADQVAVGVVQVVGDAAIWILDPGRQAEIVKPDGGLVASGVGGRYLGLSHIAVGDRVGAAVLTDAAEPALRIVGKVLLRPIGVGDRQQGVGRLGIAAGVVAVRGRQVAGGRHREQMTGRVVDVAPDVAD